MMDKRKKIRRSKFSSEESDSSSKSSSMTSSSSSDEETDAKDLKPIKEYLSNRKELASQLFKSVKAEKIRMMLPQILKKIEFADLEELCANELTGMSKTRIMSILNGQEMLQSSNTEDSDASGPSLEIISDTEWLSDEKTTVKMEGAKSKRDARKSKKPNAKSKKKLNEKGINEKLNTKVKLEKVKTEGKDKAKEKPKEKEKEGESLLDLLELEMRARAIKALLRKEDEPTAAKSGNPKDQASGSRILSNASVQARQANLKEQLEKIDVLMKHGDDEDVYVVINPAPTIELLSSDDEKEAQSKKSDEKLDSEVNKVGEQEQASTSKEKENGEKAQEKEKKTVLDRLLNIEKNAIESPEVNGKKCKDAKGKEKGKDNGNSNLPMSVIESTNDDKPESPKEPAKEEELEEGEIIDNEDDEKKKKKEETKANVESPSKEKIKKFKKNPNIRSKKRREQSDSDTNSEILEKDKLEIKKSEKNKKEILDVPIEIEDSPERKESNDPVPKSRKNSDTSSKLDEDDDKALDIEEIINLDDYPDDIDEPEKPKEPEPKIKEPESQPKSSSTKSETWASRYVQQDEVQNVIRESKIQSEIRKRLRERQRQNKLNNSPKEPDETTPEPMVVPKPTGSVEEYLALKRLADGDSSLPTDESSSQDKIEIPIETPAVIVKKPQLILPVKDEEHQTQESNSTIKGEELQAEESNFTFKKEKAEEHQTQESNSTVKGEELQAEESNFTFKEERAEETFFAVEEEQNLETNTVEKCEKNIIIKEDSSLTGKRIILVRPKQESSLKQEFEEELSLKQEFNEESALKQEFKEDTPLKQELKEESPLKQELNEESPLKQELNEELALKQEIKEESPLKQECKADLKTSDSSDDHVSVKIDNSTWTDQESSELRPD